MSETLDAGHYLDVVWLASGHRDISPSANVALYGALWRLSAWHGALLTLVPGSEANEEERVEKDEEEEEEGETGPEGTHLTSLHAWADHFQGRVTAPGGRPEALEAVRRDVAWRGEILLTDGKVNIKMTLGGDVEIAFAGRLPVLPKDILESTFHSFIMCHFQNSPNNHKCHVSVKHSSNAPLCVIPQTNTGACTGI